MSAFPMRPDSLAPLEELDINRDADHPARIINPDQWRAVLGERAPADAFDLESEAA